MRRLERRGAGRGPQVLVVDDEADIRELLELTLLAWASTVTQRALDRRGEGRC